MKMGGFLGGLSVLVKKEELIVPNVQAHVVVQEKHSYGGGEKENSGRVRARGPVRKTINFYLTKKRGGCGQETIHG